MIAFVHIYKCAGTTFNVLLRHHFGIHHVDRFGFRERVLCGNDLRAVQKLYPKVQSIAGHPVRPHGDLETVVPDIRYYTFLRDPVARAISHFPWFLAWKAHADIYYNDFDEVFRRWVADPLNRNRQCYHLHPGGTAEAAWEMIEAKDLLTLRVDKFRESLLLFRHWAGEAEMDLRVRPRNTASDARTRSQIPRYEQQIKLFTDRLKQDETLQKLLVEANTEDHALVQRVDATRWPAMVAAYPGDLQADTAALKASEADAPPKKDDTLGAKLYRNFVYKPMMPLLLSRGEPEAVLASEWY